MDSEFEPGELANRIREAGVAGAGGAGFPSYAKWTGLDDVNYLLVNHQESEPNFYSDKWLGREQADVFSDLFHALLEDAFDLIVIGTKEKYRDEWIAPLESATDATVREAGDLPLDVSDESGIVVAYTENQYDLSEEPILMMQTVDVMLAGDLPTEHGWIVQNTESIWNIVGALDGGRPVTHKYVVVDGDTPRHRLVKAPIGTTAETLLGEAGLDGLEDEQVLLDGGPGWCDTVEDPHDEFGIRKRTNALLVVDEEVAEANRDEFEHRRVNLLDQRDWSDKDHEQVPSELAPDTVRIPLMTNDGHEGLVEPAVPVVEPGDRVSVGEQIARATTEGISIPHHASIGGTVESVTDSHIVITR